jgi:hypothetical protein
MARKVGQIIAQAAAEAHGVYLNPRIGLLSFSVLAVEHPTKRLQNAHSKATGERGPADIRVGRAAEGSG